MIDNYQLGQWSIFKRSKSISQRSKQQSNQTNNAKRIKVKIQGQWKVETENPRPQALNFFPFN